MTIRSSSSDAASHPAAPRPPRPPIGSGGPDGEKDGPGDGCYGQTTRWTTLAVRHVARATVTPPLAVWRRQPRGVASHVGDVGGVGSWDDVFMMVFGSSSSWPWCWGYGGY